ncbi:MAG: hypothetical protein ACFFG0_56740 [Candidatus Thorarchaeota archaeon]
MKLNDIISMNKVVFFTVNKNYYIWDGKKMKIGIPNVCWFDATEKELKDLKKENPECEILT